MLHLGAIAWWLGCSAPGVGTVRPPVPPQDTMAPGPPRDRDPIVALRDGPPSNLLVLSIDTLRADAITAEGAPFVSARAAEGVSLTRHRSCSNWTVASMMCVWSGQTTIDLGYHPMTLDPVPPALWFLPDALAEQGFASALLTGNNLLTPESGITDGFDVGVDLHQKAAEVLVDGALTVFDEQLAGQDRWHLHVHLMDPHAPYAPPEAYLDGIEALPPIAYDLADLADVQRLKEEWSEVPDEERGPIEAHVRLRYAAEVRYLDDELARLWGELDARGALDDTLVLVVADHGEQIFEHDILGHGALLHPEETMVPAFFWARDLDPAAFAAPTTHADLAPTALHALGLPTGPRLGGEPLGVAPVGAPVFTMHAFTDRVTQVAVARDGVRLIYQFDGRSWLYRLADDPGEQAPVDPADPAAAALWEVLLPWIAEVEAVTGTVALDPGP
jgi:arylsulfatase A-like enzyme